MTKLVFCFMIVIAIGCDSTNDAGNASNQLRSSYPHATIRFSGVLLNYTGINEKTMSSTGETTTTSSNNVTTAMPYWMSETFLVDDSSTIDKSKALIPLLKAYYNNISGENDHRDSLAFVNVAYRAIGDSIKVILSGPGAHDHIRQIQEAAYLARHEGFGALASYSQTWDTTRYFKCTDSANIELTLW